MTRIAYGLTDLASDAPHAMRDLVFVHAGEPVRALDRVVDDVNHRLPRKRI